MGRVLIVDDELLLAQSLRRILADEFEVTVTSAPSMALGWIASGNWYDVVLCDVMMPGMNGLELRSQVERVAPEQAERFVFMTGGIRLPEVQALLDVTPSIVLAKPFDYGALRELIRRWAAGEPGRRQASRP
ncbi:MAG TPA: response regulator [Polyangiaceae bacterium]|nr:response regulator [Polyangiaceae bacterium]